MSARVRTVLAAAVAFAWLCAPPVAVQQARQQPQPPIPQPAAPVVTAIGMTVRDLDRSIRFYTEVLRCRLVATSEEAGDAAERLSGVFGVHTANARLALGEETIELTEYLAPRGRSLPEDSRSDDRWFQHIAIVVRDMDLAYKELRRHQVEHASPLPQTLPAWNPAAGGIRAFYFKDPDGHPLELLQFPAGKGDPKWHRAGDELFLGIDHTAIVVADTDRSLGFWRDRLGLAIAGTSDNHGIEQERLNNVFGAHLRITTLRGAGGPGVELLEYLTPRTGRTMPADSAANDLWATTVQLTSDAVAAHATAFARSGALVSAAPAAGAAMRLLVRDPDGHRALLAAPAAELRSSAAPPAK